MSRGKVQEHFCTAAHVQYRSVTSAPCTPDQLSPTVAAEPIGLPRCIWWQPRHLSPASWISHCCRGRGAGHADTASWNPQLGWRDGFARATQAGGSQHRAVHQPPLLCAQDRHYPTWMRGTAHLDAPTQCSSSESWGWQPERNVNSPNWFGKFWLLRPSTFKSHAKSTSLTSLAPISCPCLNPATG